MRAPRHIGRHGYVRQPLPRAKQLLLDAYANEVRLGDLVAPAEIPGPPQLPKWAYGETGKVVTLGRVRVGVHFARFARTELVATRPLLVVEAVDGRALMGPARPATVSRARQRASSARGRS